MKQPTKKQSALLKFINRFTEEHDYSPSYREIMRALNLNSVSAVAEHVNNCVEAGYLKRIPNTPRSLKVVPIKDYKETKSLFRQKIAEIEDELNPQSDKDGNVARLSDEKRRGLEDDVMTLKAAANLLDLKL